MSLTDGLPVVRPLTRALLLATTTASGQTGLANCSDALAIVEQFD